MRVPGNRTVKGQDVNMSDLEEGEITDDASNEEKETKSVAASIIPVSAVEETSQCSFSMQNLSALGISAVDASELESVSPNMSSAIIV